jgi:arginase
MTQPDSSRTGGSIHDGVNLRLIWPRWQGGGTSSVKAYASEFPFNVARRGYAVGSAVLEAVLPSHDGPTTAAAPVTMSDAGLEQRNGIEAKTVILEQLAGALEVIRQHDPARITTLGGECSVSVAPFAVLARRYGDDPAILWIDSHPDIGTRQSEYPGYHAMAVATLTGHGDPAVLELLPAIVSPDRVALVGLHSWTDDDFRNVAEWGIQSFSREELRESTRPCSTGWLPPAAPASPPTSTSTRSTATRLCSVSAPNRTGLPAPRCGASSATSMEP